MRHTHDGLTLWYGTQDAPAPEGIVDPTQNLCVTVGLSPARPSNTVRVLYRVGREFERTVRASLLPTVSNADAQYFQAFLPKFPPGSKVKYAVIGECCGLQVPGPDELADIEREIEVIRPSLSTSLQKDEEPFASPLKGRLPFHLEYFCHFTIQLVGDPPEIIGETPDGIKVNWYIKSGQFAGPKLNGRVRAQGGDWMTIRRDGIGLINVRATLETFDNALISLEHRGFFDLGENGYHNFLNKQWTPVPPLRISSRLHTAHHTYVWLNRIHFIGVGHVIMEKAIAEYDLYAVR